MEEDQRRAVCEISERASSRVLLTVFMRQQKKLTRRLSKKFEGSRAEMQHQRAVKFRGDVQIHSTYPPASSMCNSVL